MFCTNCSKEIGQQPSCQYCGFNPALDTGAVQVPKQPRVVKPRPVNVRLIPSTNGPAIAAMILNFIIGWPILSLIPLILGFVGLAKSKSCHSGKVLSIVSIIIALVITLFWFIIFYAALKDAGMIN